MPRSVDFIVVGSGIAGLTFATKAAHYGEVLILTKKRKADSNTNYAQGGIAAVFGSDDSFSSHINDTLKTGEGLCNREAVEIMVREGPKLVEELYRLGCRFSTTDKGRFELGKEGGHTKRRIVHAKDFTGQEIERVLIEETKDHNITISENEIVLDLIVGDEECTGLYYLDANTQKIDMIYANATVLATGGIGQVYAHTTNPPIATGDGIAMAYRGGAQISNMEFVQFHPTAVYNIKIDGRSFLVSEAVRGEGGILKTKKGKAFMKKYHPMANLAPRDIVARACLSEMLKDNDPYVLLDMTHMKADFIKNRFPTIYETCFRWGIDVTRESIPVVPAAHYLCGGIQVNTWAESSIKRLYALGECACTGVHGANRLASNSLLEALVFASRAAQRVAKSERIKIRKKTLPFTTAKPGPDFKMQIKELMSKYAGVLRIRSELEKARQIVNGYCSRFDKGIHLVNVESRNMTEISEMVIQSCLLRKESRGLHAVQEYPKKDDKYLKDTAINNKGIRV